MNQFLKAIRSAALPDVAHHLPVSDFSQFETAAADPARTALLIARAAVTRAGGGPPAPKLSDTAERILAAGRKRRGE